MVNYANGKIYKITNDVDDRKYYGSTVQSLSARMVRHRIEARCGSNRILYNHMREVGIEHFKIYLVKHFPCNSKEELLAEEGKYIRKLHGGFRSLNKVIAGRTKKQYREDNKDKIKQSAKQYREANKEKIRKTKKQYREANKNKEKDRMKQYYEANKDKMKQYREANKDKKKQYQKQYYEAKKDKLYCKFNCDCGGKYTHANKTIHYKTRKHQKWVQLNN